MATVLIVLALVLFGAGAVIAVRERGHAFALIALGLALWAAAEVFAGGTLST